MKTVKDLVKLPDDPIEVRKQSLHGFLPPMEEGTLVYHWMGVLN